MITAKPSRHRISILIAAQCLLFTAIFSVLDARLARAAENAEAIEARLGNAVRLLASDEYEGRGIGTKGLDQAAEYIAEELAEIGLDVRVLEESPFQKFKVTTSAEIGPKAENSLRILPAADDGKPVDLKLGEDFNPLAAGGSAEFDLPLAFVGYGITAKDADYDDYENVDVKDKCVIVLRHQPQRGNPHGSFGEDPSRHAFFQTKISNAVAHGAAAIIFCTGSYEIEKELAQLQKRWEDAVNELAAVNKEFRGKNDPSPDDVEAHRKTINRLAERIQATAKRMDEAHDPVLSFFRAGAGSANRRIAILHCRRKALDETIRAATGKDLAALEDEIDTTGKPVSQELKSWRVDGKTSIRRNRADVRNVIAVLEGEGPNAEETIVLGAHYDHLGYGGPNSAEPGSKKIHNGADDNASGIAALLEVARRLTSLDRKLPRRVVFVAFTGEEQGLLGSAHYIKNPVVPLNQTVAMLNMDMVGRLKDNKLIVHGTGTADEFELLVKRLNAQHGFELVKKPSGFGPSDHASFYEKKIPVLHFFTGAHKDYHRPSDDADKVNVTGMRRIASLVADITVALADAQQPPTYRQTKRTKVAGGRWPYFGSRPDYAFEEPGVRMAGVAADSPAERAGVKEGDVMIQFGKSKVETVADFANALSGHKAGDKVVVVVRRDGQEVRLTVTLDPPRR